MNIQYLNSNKFPVFFLPVFLFSCYVNAQQIPDEIINWPDTIYTNAIVVTLDEHQMNDDPGTIAEAIAVKGEKILAIGTAQHLATMKGPNTQVIDIGGKMLIPGFIESHTHPFSLIEQNLPEQELQLQHVSMGIMVEATPEETYKKITRYADEAGIRPGEWVLIELQPNPAKGVTTIWDIAEGWIGTPDEADQTFTRAGLTGALPNNPANAGVRNVREPDGSVRRHNSLKDVEILREATVAYNEHDYDTLVADVVAHQRRALLGLTGSHAYIIFNDLGWEQTNEWMPGLEATV